MYNIPYLETNDWGSYDLITNYFLKEKDEIFWKLLLTNDTNGINKIALASSKQKVGWRVVVFWYDDILSDGEPSPAFTESALQGFENCLDRYNFYQRRWHDYDYTKGIKRKPGEGATECPTPPCFKDDPPQKPRPTFKPPVTSVDDEKKPPVKPEPTEKKPNVPILPKPVIKKPSNPKPKPPSENDTQKQLKDKLKRNDIVLKEKLDNDTEVRQVVRMDIKYNWLE